MISCMEKEIVISNNILEITHVTNFIKEVGTSLQLPPVVSMNMSLAIEEAIVTIVKNTYLLAEEYKIKLTVKVVRSELVFMLIYDEVCSDFTLFDKLSSTLIVQIMDEISYKCINGKRCLIMTKGISDKVEAKKTMTVNICRVDEITVITIEGRLDTVRAQEFEQVVNTLQTRDYSNIIINCENLTYICSTGIRHLLLLQKNVTKNKGQLILEAMKPEIYDIFVIIGGNNMFTIR